jgi:hypothetical protein
MNRNKGTWIVEEITNEKNRYAIDDDGYPVATVVGEANANLIAAAPKMLELLKLLDHGNHRSGLGSNYALNNRLRFALCRLFGKRKGNSLSRQIKDTIARAEGNQTRLTEES